MGVPVPADSVSMVNERPVEPLGDEVVKARRVTCVICGSGGTRNRRGSVWSRWAPLPRGMRSPTTPVEAVDMAGRRAVMDHATDVARVSRHPTASKAHR